ncbi:Ddc1 [Kluyveromyces lactis]|nr:Ddc1 [Kluyveromyces lactis]
MSFRASINSTNEQTIWGKCLATLSQINPDVFITITEDSVLISSMNATDTTMAKVRFPKSFFTEYHFEPKKIVFGESGVQQITDCNDILHTIYSFKTNGKYLSLLSLKQEDTIKEYMLTIDNCDNCSETIANKLIIKMKTASLLTKEYQINFDPLESVQIILSLKYKQKFLSVYNNKSKGRSLDPRLVDYFKSLQTELEHDMFNRGIANEHNIVSTVKNTPLTVNDEINFLSFDQSILRNFIDSIMSNVIEEIKLELTRHTLAIIGFTKAVYNMKSQGYLKQAVTVTNTCSANDLEHYCIFSTEKNDGSRPSSRSQSIKKSITFKLRDFKVFLNGLNCWKTNDMIRIWFCQPGDPILFEITKDGVVLELVQVTDTEGRVEEPEDSVTQFNLSPEKTVSPIKKDTVVKPDKLQRPESKQILYPHTKRSLFITDEDGADDDNEDEEGRQFRFKRWGKQNSNTAFNSNNDSQSTPSNSTTEPSISEPVKRMRTTVEWGGTIESNNVDTDESHQREMNKAAYLNNLKRQAIQEDLNLQEDDASMGPTQADRPKGLFDS